MGAIYGTGSPSVGIRLFSCRNILKQSRVESLMESGLVDGTATQVSHTTPKNTTLNIVLLHISNFYKFS